MKVPLFGITKEGQLYHREGSMWIWLGHIAYSLEGDTALARAAGEWWKAWLASDEPTENLVLPDDRSPSVVLVSETHFEPSWQPSPEPVEAVPAAA